MKAFHNDPKVKEFYINRIKQHQAADEITKGIYWENGKGCAVGCTLHSNNHAAYETELGIPKILAWLEDRIFENIPNELSKNWPLQFLDAIKIGADLSTVWPKFSIFLMLDESQCAGRLEINKIVAQAYQDQLDNKDVDWVKIKIAAADADAAADAAYDAAADADAYADAAAYAAAYAAYAYAAAAAAAAAYATDAAAAYAAAYAAYATDAAAAYADAKKQAYIKQSEKLLQLLSDCA